MIDTSKWPTTDALGSVGLDIDGTITADPALFSELANAVRTLGRRVHIVSSRSPSAEGETRAELEDLGVQYDELFLLPDFGRRIERCPHRELSWYDQYIWQKVEYCVIHNISTFFDDDRRVMRLFARYASQITAVPVVSVATERTADKNIDVVSRRPSDDPPSARRSPL